MEAQAKTAVVSDAAGTGMRLPGSGTLLRVHGLAEAHAVHDLKQSGSPDVFTDLTYQPLDNAGGQRGKTKFTAQTSRFGFETSTPIGANKLTTKVEADFYSYGSSKRNRLRLRLRQATVNTAVGW